MADYDYIIVGAGSAGGTLAARLTENSSNRVLLLEAGAASHPYSRMPLSFGLLIDNPAANQGRIRRRSRADRFIRLLLSSIRVTLLKFRLVFL